jgi:hypothetical protein
MVQFKKFARTALVGMMGWMGVMGLALADSAAAQTYSLAESGMMREYELAVQALMMGESTWAEWHYRNTIMYAERAGVRDERIASSCFEVAMIRLEASDLAEAYRMMRQAYITRGKLLGEDHPDVHRTGRVLASIEAQLAAAGQKRAVSAPATSSDAYASATAQR